ncbi:hypothetical protein ACQ4N7_28855 [Nodosilinea sp. AN01ver1]|uniref:hypothetical protein n=1 Tax=Nodosilinea sp. AN01ver1 TaxID=3423362 RepID=UPI003D315800
MTNQDEQSRQRLTQQRQQAEHARDNRLERSEEELHQSSDQTVEEKARQAMANQHHRAEHTRDNLLERSEEDLH